jgi:hypothetical protein
MMKKIILRTVVSLLVLGGMVATPFGVGMAEAVDCLQISPTTKIGDFKKTLPGGDRCFGNNVRAVITIEAGHNIKIYHHEGEPFKEPKDAAGNRPVQTGQPVNVPKEPNLPPPLALQHEVTGSGGKYKYTPIEVAGNNTCLLWGGVWYCW